MKVLFVCTQNVFRSFSAERALKKILEDKKDDSITVSSAGTNASPENPYSWTIEILENYGIDTTSHNQKRATQEMVDNNDIIICMTRNHKKYIENNFGKKCYLFNEIAHGKITDLEDDLENNNYDSLSEFVRKTTKYIIDSTPKIYERLITISSQSQ